MAEETTNILTGKRVSTTFRGLLHFPHSIDATLAKQVVYDGSGTASALKLGGDTIGMDVSGPISCVGSISGSENLSIIQNVSIGGDVVLSNGGRINEVNILSSGSSVSLRAPSAAEVGKLRIRETSSDYELLFGNPTVSDKNLFSIIVKNDPTSNFYIKNSYSDVDINSPLWINRSTGEVNIKSLRVTNIKTDPPPGTSPPPGQPEKYGDPNRNVLPIGMICMFPVSGIPSGWIPCDGKQHDKRTLPELFTVIGYNYSAVKSGFFFQVPDYRGLFVRGLDYKRSDEMSHTFLDPLSTRPLDGTVQEDTVKPHVHHIDNVTRDSCTRYDWSAGVGFGGPVGNIPTDGREVVISSGGGMDSDPNGGIETSPKNVVALYCIKW